MKKILKKTKAFITTVAIVMTLLLPITTNAQSGSDGFFSSSNMDDFDERTSWEFSAANQQFGQKDDDPQPTPLGSGLIIMTVAGASYVLLKNKKEE